MQSYAKNVPVTETSLMTVSSLKSVIIPYTVILSTESSPLLTTSVIVIYVSMIVVTSSPLTSTLSPAATDTIYPLADSPLSPSAVTNTLIVISV